ncbi:hypothetical protein FSPOR_580 [Fusarium sporotrichioides]|uniref:Uncharacterized protein n=1 Tax=Fusarium sporotrichioides TaxID=5514 RepID=A0A395SUP7_FUSSP|nr:hypothetical protein FSPOR_580 [Fusarium sporotrichioides]
MTKVKMLTSEGSIKSIDGDSKFVATFIIDDIQYHYSGAFSPAVQNFQSDDVMLQYPSIESLTSTQDFEGVVGTEGIEIDIQSSNVRITGILDPPISPASCVSGAGTWSQN